MLMILERKEKRGKITQNTKNHQIGRLLEHCRSLSKLEEEGLCRPNISVAVDLLLEVVGGRRLVLVQGERVVRRDPSGCSLCAPVRGGDR
jgi:hypothetical protein